MKGLEDLLSYDEFVGYCKGNIISLICDVKSNDDLEEIGEIRFYVDVLDRFIKSNERFTNPFKDVVNNDIANDALVKNITNDKDYLVDALKKFNKLE